MQYEQLVSPNLSVIGTVGLCEKYTEDVFGVGAGRHDADAIAGWKNDKGQHPKETPPSNISAPIAFDWYGTVDGVYKNWGHRCVWYKGKVYSSPLKGNGHLVYNSIQEIQNAFGLSNYLGWSEYIEDLRIVQPKGGSTMNNTQKHDVGTALYRTGLHREPESSAVAETWGAKFQDGKGAITPNTIISALNAYRATSEWKSQDAKLKSNGPTPAQVNVGIAAVFNKQANADEKADYSKLTWDNFLQTLYNNSVSQRTKAANFDKVQAALNEANKQLTALKQQPVQSGIDQATKDEIAQTASNTNWLVSTIRKIFNIQ